MATRARRWTRWLPVAGLVLVALALSVYAWWPAIDAYPSTQGGDGPQYHKMLEAARVSIRRYHELPLWNPYECGGLPLWDNPQAFVGAPLAWLTFVFGTTKTMEYWFVLHSALGFLAMWVFARDDVRLSRAASFVASSVWAFNGFHQQHYSGGHVTFVPFLYFPFALWLWRRAERDVRFAVGLGLLVAWMMYEGAVYPIPHLAILLAAESLTRAWPPRRLPLLLRAGAIAGLVAFTVAASRFLPVMDQLHTHTRQIGGEHEYLHWHTLKEMFLARTHARYAEEQDYVWPEWGAYLGPILLALAALGVLVEGLEHLWLFALLIFVFLLMGGHFSRFAPWHLLKLHLFPFKEMRVPSRFRCEVTMFFALFIGIAIDRVPKLVRLARRVALRVTTRPYLRIPARLAGLLRLTLLAFALIGVGDMIGVGKDWFAQCFTNPPSVRMPASTRLYFGGAGLAQFIDEPAQNRGRVQCWDEWGFGWGAPLWEGDVPQARAATSDATVEVANRTQNTFTLDVDAAAPTRILLNSTYDRGWRPSVGTAVEVNKELAIDLPAGRHHVVVKYWPHGLTAGLWLSGLGIAGVVAFFVYDHARRKRLASS